MIHSVRAVILNATKTGEKTLVLHTLSRSFGRRSFIATISRTAPAPMFLPLNILDAEVIENPKSELWRLRNISLVYPLNGIRSNLYKNTISLFMSEVLYRTVRDGQGEDGLFDWVERNILLLDNMEDDFSNFHLRFLFELCSALGFSASFEDLAPFAGTQARHIDKLLSSSFSEFMLYPLKGSDRSAIASCLTDYLSAHTETRLNIRSLKVLGDIYGQL